MKVFLNGRLLDEAHACVSIFDHGFLYGDGVYETVVVGATRREQCEGAGQHCASKREAGYATDLLQQHRHQKGSPTPCGSTNCKRIQRIDDYMTVTD